jgi:hypothetical protein
MARWQLRLKLADYVVLAINPALVGGVVGSLVFFLAEILYAGAHDQRMKFVLFWFVVGMVGVTRVALTAEASERTGLYAVALGVAVYLALLRFIEYPAGWARQWGWLINVFLLGITWWTAHCLTRDCTHLDDDAEIGNEGVLDAAGFGAAAAPEPPPPEPAVNGQAIADDAARSEQIARWLERYEREREEERRKKRTPGVWVVYYSLAALPIFGLGQALLPVEAVERRRYTYLLLCLYVACALGLLLTTAFLGLRRYLRQRGTRMPLRMTGSWLTTGMVLIALFLVAAAVVPRPLAEYSLNPWANDHEQREASQRSALRSSPGKDRSKTSGNSDKERADKGEESGRNGTAKDGKAGDRPGEGGKGEADKASGPQGKDGKGGDKRGQDGDKNNDQGKDGRQKGDAPTPGEEKKDGPGQSGSPPSPPSGALQGLAVVLKWIAFGIVILGIVLLLLYFGLRYLSSFLAWARRLLDALHNFWAGLFGGGGGAQATEPEAAAPQPPPPFAVFSNPFHDGRARGMSPRELTNYSFQALESWAMERRVARADDETPLEFTNRVAGETPAIEDQVVGLGSLFTAAAYGNDSLPADAVGTLRDFWEGLENANAGSPERRGAEEVEP